MDLPIKRQFRFLMNEEFNALDTKAKALYLLRAQQELEVQQSILRRYRENLTAQVGAVAELPGGDLRLPGPDTRQ